MGNTYAFTDCGPDEAKVECPQLDIFIKELKAVCKRHGIGFTLEDTGYGYDCSVPEMVMVPFKSADFDWITNGLDEYRGGIPWLDAAKAEYIARRDGHYEEQEVRTAKAEAGRQKYAAEQLIHQGIELGGKHYKLVEG